MSWKMHFGILANRFRVFMTPIQLIAEKVEAITMACCVLHNFLRSRSETCSIYTPPGSIDTEDPETHAVQLGEWHHGQQSTGLLPLAKQGSNHYFYVVKDIRDQLCKYFNSEDGAVEWQWKIV